MAKKQKKPSAKPGLSRGQYILLTLLALVVVLPTAYLGYHVYLNKADARKFATLQSDFKKLQGEFNKIDPGWEYGESCVGRGGVYSDGQASSCAMSISNNFKRATLRTISNDYREAIKRTGLFIIEGDDKAFQSDGKEHLETILTNKGTGEKTCDLLITLESRMNMEYSASIGCRSPARSFYYDRIDR